MICTRCQKVLSNKVFRANGRVDVYCSCGFDWQGFSDPHAVDDYEMNEFYGDWNQDEIFLTLRALAKSKVCDDDRRFFKGRTVFTVWREGDGPKKVKVYLKLQSLLAKI